MVEMMRNNNPKNDQNGDIRSKKTVDGLITNAIKSILHLWKMQPAKNNAQQTHLLPTIIALEIVWLFPTFQHAAINANRDPSQNLDWGQRGSNQQANVKSSNSKIPKKKKLVHKDIVFILNPSVDKVPTHQTQLK